MKQSVTILPLEAIPREPSGCLASLACRGVRGAVFQLCHRRRAWMRLLPSRPLLSSVAADGVRPAQAEQARSSTEKQGARQRRSSPFPLLESESGALHGRWRRDGGLELLRRAGDEEGPRASPPCRSFLPSPPPLHITSTSWPRSPLLLFFTKSSETSIKVDKACDFLKNAT
jgi:hypothetical protein